ncbi:MAG: WhiB family transcriptional regulator [Acidimicrobiales bacterium]
MIEDLFATAEGDLTWMDEALCQGKADLFFAPPGERRIRRQNREAIARSYCENCRQLLPCRRWARENREHGFWGGENEEQRAMLGYPPRSPSRRAIAEIGRSTDRELAS